jgi:hypothetical protein
MSVKRKASLERHGGARLLAQTARHLGMTVDQFIGEKVPMTELSCKYEYGKPLVFFFCGKQEASR